MLERKLYIIDMRTLQSLQVLETCSNPNGRLYCTCFAQFILSSPGLCALSPEDSLSYLAFPSSAVSGELILYNTLALNVSNLVQAHHSPVAAMAFSACGRFLATASEKVCTLSFQPKHPTQSPAGNGCSSVFCASCWLFARVSPWIYSSVRQFIGILHCAAKSS